MPRALAALVRARAAREAAVFLGFCLLTAVMTWPWAANLEDAVADTGDPYMIAWALWWDYHQTFGDPLNLFHANVFYPYRYTLAFSENDYGISLLLFPLFAAGARPLTVHSVATFLGFALCGYGAFRLARTLTGSRGAAWVAGFVYAFIPFRFESLAHLHYLFAGWMPLLLEALVLFARGRTWRRAAWLGAAFVMNALTCVTWMVLTVAPLALTGLLLLACDPALRRGRDFWLRGGVALGAAALVLLPFLLPYYRVSEMYGLRWQAWEFAANSATVWHWLEASARLKLWAGVGDVSPGDHRLFPGLLPPLLALAALLPRARGADGRTGAVGPRGISPRGISSRGAALGVALVWTVWGFLSSLGANFFLNRLMYEYLLPYRSVRVPSRAAMVCYVGLAVLAGVGAARVARLASARRARVYAPALAVLVLALAFDLRAFPLDIQSGALDPDAVTLRLKETPMRGGLVELPSDECCSRHRYMLRAADHGKPLVNATSSFNSPLADEVHRLSNASPVTDELLELLERTPASYLVVHHADVPPWRRPDLNSFLARAVSNGRLRFVRRFDGRDDLYAVTKTEPEARAEEPPPAELVLRDWASLVGEDPANLLVGYADWGQALYRLRLVERGRMPRYDEFMRDAAEVGQGLFVNESGARDFEERLRRLARASAEGAQFRARYGGLDDARYAARLYEHAGLDSDAAGRDALAAALASGAETRASALVRVAQDPRLVERERHRSTLLLHYFGFLRRNPDDPPDNGLEGFNFWLGELERRGEPSKIALAFRESFEYKRLRGE